jgi:hypothetical protein
MTPTNAQQSLAAKDLHFLTGQVAESEALVMRYHYSKRVPGSVLMIGSLHEQGGLFGDQGPAAAAAFFSSPPTRWTESVIELTRLVRRDDVKVPLSRLIAFCCKELKKRGFDLIVSFADRTQGHEGYVYRACSWNYAGCNERANDGVIMDGTFIPGRSCNARFGTRSPTKLQEMFPEREIVPHYDEGKHLYWKALNKSGKKKAERLGLAAEDWKALQSHAD